METKDCPCKSGKLYGNCCGPFIKGTALPPFPEALMRSRYTAFCMKISDYLLATLAPEKRLGEEVRLRRELDQTMARTRWVGLNVVARGPDTDPDRGMVEFIAFFEQGGGLGQLHERSAFVRQDGKWYYLDGEILAPVPLTRNQPCVCGSGLKYKRCHGKS